MSKDMRSGWLSELKVGSPVFIDFKTGKLEVAKVDKITPTGRIKIESYVFNSDGWMMGWDRMVPRLVEYSKETHQKINESKKRLRLAYEIEDVRFRELSLEKLTKIKSIIEE